MDLVMFVHRISVVPASEIWKLPTLQLINQLESFFLPVLLIAHSEIASIQGLLSNSEITLQYFFLSCFKTNITNDLFDMFIQKHLCLEVCPISSDLFSCECIHRSFTLCRPRMSLTASVRRSRAFRLFSWQFYFTEGGDCVFHCQS